MSERRFVASALFFTYFVGLLLLDVPWWRAFVVSGCFAGAFVAGLSMRMLSRGAVLTLVLGSLVWLGALPGPAVWKSALSEQYRQIVATVVPNATR